MAAPPAQLPGAPAGGFGGYGQEQMQQMLMSMMAGGGTMPGMPPPMPQAGCGGMLPTMPAVDPGMVQLFQQYLQTQTMPYGASLPSPALLPPYNMAPGAAGATAAAQAAADPTVSVSVEGMKFQYQLTEDDLQKVFKRYGTVKQVKVDEVCSSATVSFASANDAQAAIRDLDGKVLNGLDGTLRVSWIASVAPTVPYAGNGFPQLSQLSTGFPSLPQAMAYNPAVAGSAGMMPPTLGMPGGAQAVAGQPGSPDTRPPHVKGQKKFTCRFIIGIENDKEFQVARRLIGAKGANMKRIVKVTEAKLRLRGQGSGYFEGAGQKESPEPLQLCVSCTSQEGYKTAVHQVEELLTRIYEEYRQWCGEHGLPIPDLRLNLSESQLVYSSSRGAPYDAPVGGAEASGSPRRRGGQRGGRSKSGRASADTGEEGDRGEAGPNAPPVDEIERLIQERNQARRACNFAEADRIRDFLHRSGVGLMDEPGGRGKGNEVTTWRYWRD